MSLRSWKQLSQSRRGFTATELSVVLGVIGLIVAGIFVTASVARSQLRLNEAMDELSIIVNNTRSYYSGKAVPSNPVCFGASSATVMPANAGWTLAQYRQYGIFPTEMTFTSNGKTLDRSAVAALSYPTTSASVDVCGSNPVQLDVRYAGLATQDCVNLVVRTSALAFQTNLYQITVAAQNFPISNGGISPTNATLINACTPGVGGGTITVTWYYKLNG